jgi:hypothetical protein
MTQTTAVRPSRRRFRGRLPAFLPVPVHGRHNGWTPQRQGDFIGFLAETGSVSKAARIVGMSRQSVYELRGRPGGEGFAAAWDAALGLPFRKVTETCLSRRAFENTIRPLMRAGRYRGSAHKPSSSALLRLLDRLDRAALRSFGGIEA